MIPIGEMVGKLRAALEARSDPSLVVLARTSAIRIGGLEEAVSRVKAYTDTGVDGVFLTGVTTPDELEAMRGATSLPLLLGAAAPTLGDRIFLGQHGVRISLQGHYPFQAAVRAVYDTLKHLKEGGPPAALTEKVASPDMMARYTRREDYGRWHKDFLT